MSEQSPNTSSSSFFNSPPATPAVGVTGGGSVSATPVRSTPAQGTMQHQAAHTPIQTNFIDHAAAHRNVPPSSSYHMPISSNIRTVPSTTIQTPLVGMQLSFTPAMHSAKQQLPTSAIHGGISSAAHLQSQHAADYAAQQRFSSTPSVAVPLAFATPSAPQDRQFRMPPPSAYVASNPLFTLTSNTPPSAAANSHQRVSSNSAASTNTAFPFHTSNFGAHASLPSSRADALFEGASMPPLPPAPIHIPRGPLRNLIRSASARGHHSTALFYADKLATLENYSTESVYMLAQTLTRGGHFMRAVHLLRKSSVARLPHWNMSAPLDVPDLHLRMKCLYLTLQCHVESGNSDEALNCCLPSEETSLQMDGLGEEERAKWQRLLDEFLRAAASSTSTGASDSLTNPNSLANMREILGHEECDLILQLIQFQAMSKSYKEREARKKQPARPAHVQHDQDGDFDMDGHPIEALPQDSIHSSPSTFDEDEIDLCSSIAYLRASIYEVQQKKFQAILWYKLALYFDVRNYESFEKLTSKRLLTSREEFALFSSVLKFPRDLQWLKLMWLNKIDVLRIDDTMESASFNPNSADGQGGQTRGMRGDGLLAPVADPEIEQAIRSGFELDATSNAEAITPATIKQGKAEPEAEEKTAAPAKAQLLTSIPDEFLHSSSISSLLYRYRLLSTTYQFGNNHDLLANIIEYKYNMGQFRECYEMSKKIIDTDPYMLTILPNYVCTLVELKMKSELFHCAHQLVNAYPDKAISWFTVGCYYYLLNKLDYARRFFYKAAKLDSFFVYAWFAFGHTFSFQDESDQALLSYRNCYRLYEGSHYPLLCIGMEYLKTNNFILATHFLQQAIQANKHDPLPHNELGIIAFKNGDYAGAVTLFLRCLSLVKQNVLENWECTLFNLGHAYRKLKKYKEAITAYNRALSVASRQFTILTALGFTYHLQGQFHQAIEYYHKALGLNPRDTFTTDMLDRALKEVFEEGNILGEDTPLI